MTREDQIRCFIGIAEKILLVVITVAFASIAYCFDYVLKNGPESNLIAVGTMTCAILAEGLFIYLLIVYINSSINSVLK